MYYIILVINLYLCVQIDSKTVPSAPKEELVVGGVEAPDGITHAVALHYNGGFICTSTLISPLWILTAAHCCVFGGKAQPADFFYGILNKDRTASVIRVDMKEVVPHPQYNGTSINNDIALMKAKSPVENVSPVRLAGPDYPIKAGKHAAVIGWGRTRNTDPLPNDLQIAFQKVIPNSICGLINSGVNKDKLCAWGFVIFGACSGDSGGPLISRSDNVQIGITSYLNGYLGCGVSPAVFTRTASFKGFIESVTNDSSVTFV